MLSSLGENMEDRSALPPDPSQTSPLMGERSTSSPPLSPPGGSPPPTPGAPSPPVSPLPPPLQAVPPLSSCSPPPSHPPLPSLLPPRPTRPKPPPPPIPRSVQPAPPPSLSPPLRRPPSPRPPQASRLPPPLSPTPCPPLSPLLPAPLSPRSSSPVTCSARRPSPPLLFSLSAPPQSSSSSSLIPSPSPLSPAALPSPSPLSPAALPSPSPPPPPRGSEEALGEAWAWRVRELDQEQLTSALEGEAAGVFLVQCRGEKVTTLSVRLPEGHGVAAVQNVLVQQYDTFLHLQGSCLLFDDIIKLVSFYCFSRDVLPVTLRLPKVITMATREDLPAISAMAEEFWSRAAGPLADGEENASPMAPRRFCHVRLDILEKDRLSPTPSPAPSLSPAPSTALSPTPIPTPSPAPSPALSPAPSAAPSAAAPPPPQEAPPSGVAHGDGVRTPDPQNARFKRAPPRPPSLSGGGGPRREDEGSKVEEGPQTTPPHPPPPPSRPPVPSQARPPPRLPPAPLRRASSRGGAKGPAPEGRPGAQGVKGEEGEEGGDERRAVGDLLQLDAGRAEEEEGAAERKDPEGKERGEDEGEQGPDPSPVSPQPPGKRPSRPVPPPRRKQTTRGATANQSAGVRAAPPSSVRRPDVSLYSPQGGGAVGAEHDSCSSSSSEEELGEASQGEELNHSQRCDGPAPAKVKRTPTTVMLGRARNRLSSVLTGLISPDRRLTQRLVELTRDPLSYLGNLVKEHRAFTLETLSRHASSTELLQEIRTMMTQLKIYLLQSSELQAMLDPQHQYPPDKLDSIAETVLSKSVLKPLRGPIYQSLERLHTRDLQGLALSQSSVLASTSTALGVTTAVPEAAAMEKISGKLRRLHLEYSPQRKIMLLLKTCRIIYDSMAVSGPGRAHGADDFLPVMMYVLARSNLAHLALDVEYMMELMDPALTLGEGSYYLTTTYGALEHIKTFDQQRAATRQLSLEVQDSIHRWERRRTLNQEHLAQRSVQDFLTVCCPETGSNPTALGVRPATTVLELTEQCAARFEQDSYIISVLTEGLVRPLAPTELALAVKQSLPPGACCFVFHPAHRPPGLQAGAASPRGPGETGDGEGPGETAVQDAAPLGDEAESLIDL